MCMKGSSMVGLFLLKICHFLIFCFLLFLLFRCFIAVADVTAVVHFCSRVRLGQVVPRSLSRVPTFFFVLASRAVGKN